MAPLSKLTLTSYRRTQPNRDAAEERPSKTLAPLEQQKLILAAHSMDKNILIQSQVGHGTQMAIDNA